MIWSILQIIRFQEQLGTGHLKHAKTNSTGFRTVFFSTALQRYLVAGVKLLAFSSGDSIFALRATRFVTNVQLTLSQTAKFTLWSWREANYNTCNRKCWLLICHTPGDEIGCRVKFPLIGAVRFSWNAPRAPMIPFALVLHRLFHFRLLRNK